MKKTIAIKLIIKYLLNHTLFICDIFILSCYYSMIEINYELNKKINCRISIVISPTSKR